MSTKQLSAPQVFAPAGSTPLTEISISTYRTEVIIVINGLPGGTTVTTDFEVEGTGAKHDKGTAVANQPLRIPLQAASYKLHENKDAEITYTIDGSGDISPPLKIKIVK